ncbi:MAG TPA: GNAT family N-acetyltransferase [Acidimicrobiales bacterium]|nr:GNAT family N-acetyltransferase [Acidimicrobiales bacterium]
MTAFPEELAAGRVHLRRLRRSDVDELMQVIRASQNELSHWLPSFADPSEEAELAFLQNAEDDFDAGRDFGFAVVDEAGGIVGGAGLHRQGPRRAAIGYWAATDRTRGGNTTAAAEALVSAAFAHLTCDVVEIQCDAANHASAAIPARLGFRLADGQPRAVLCSGHTGWGLIWEMRRQDWGASRSPVVVGPVGPEARERLVASFAPSADYFDEMLPLQAAGLTQLVAAEVGATVVGDVCVRSDGAVEPEVAAVLAGVPFINHLEVADTARRRGVGARLVLAGEAIALARGAVRIFLGVETDNPGARRIYQRLGYQPWPFGLVPPAGATGSTGSSTGTARCWRSW